MARTRPQPAPHPRQPEATAAWDLMGLAAHGVPVPRGDLRKAIRRAWPMFQEDLNAGTFDDPSELGVAGFRCTVVFGALATLWGVEPHEVQELWTSGLLDCALRDEFDPRGRLGLGDPA